jgi:pimeloyl-ACP methyl ester carboxylesterase
VVARTLTRRQAITGGAVGVVGVAPLALASADGRGGSWRRATGDDPFAMLLEELLPLLAGLGLRTRAGTVGVLGWSMGGAGALRLAEAAPERLAAVAIASAQLRFLAGALGR